jgi:tetratricopeptide (TPR) repeat protein
MHMARLTRRTPGPRPLLSAFALQLGRLATVALLLMVSPAIAHAAEARRYRVDEDDLAWMEKDRPEAAAQLLEGEAAIAAGDLQRAADLFHQASTKAAQGALPARRECQALTALGRHDQAVTACSRAVENKGSALDFRALVGAYMSGDKPPTMQDAGMAVIFARRARDLMPTEPWGYAAQCDIAEKLGDTAMFKECVDTLLRIAPGHFETERALAIAARLRPGWGTVTCWLAIALATLGTLSHALLAKRRSFMNGGLGVAVLLCVLGSFSTTAWAGISEEPTPPTPPVEEHTPHAGALSIWPINHQNPESSVPTPQQRDSNPLEYGYHLMDLTDAAVAATKAGDHQAAVKYYRALAKAVPDVSISFGKLCESYDAAGDRANAIGTCAIALGKPGVRLVDFQHYARLLLSKPGTLDSAEVEDVDTVIAHLKTDEAGRPSAYEIECNLAVRIGDVKRLEECTPILNLAAPDDSKTIFFQWSLALMHRDFSGAKDLLERAKASSMPPKDIRFMEEAMVKALPIWRRFMFDWRLGATLALMVLGGAALLTVSRRPELQTGT